MKTLQIQRNYKIQKQKYNLYLYGFLNCSIAKETAMKHRKYLKVSNCQSQKFSLSLIEQKTYHRNQSVHKLQNKNMIHICMYPMNTLNCEKVKVKI